MAVAPMGMMPAYREVIRGDYGRANCVKKNGAIAIITSEILRQRLEERVFDKSVMHLAGTWCVGEGLEWRPNVGGRGQSASRTARQKPLAERWPANAA